MPDTTTTDKNPQITCVARRHMKPAAFVTYDAMMATAIAGQKAREREGKPRGLLLYKGSLADLANKSNRSMASESAAISELLAEGWAIAIQEKPEDPKQRRNKRAGTWATCEYRVIEHSEFAQSHECPPPKYDEKGNLMTPGELKPGLRRANVRKMVGLEEMPDSWADAVGAAIDGKKAATRNLVPVTDTRKLVAVEPPPQETLGPPPQETLGRAATRNLVPTDTRNLVPTATRNLVTRFASLPAASPTNSSSPAAFPPAEEPGGQGGPDVSERSAVGDSNPKPLDEKEHWQQFIKHPDMPGIMRGAIPTDEQRTAVLKLLAAALGWKTTFGTQPSADELLEDFVNQIRDWAEQQSPPIETLKFHRWRRFLETFVPEG